MQPVAANAPAVDLHQWWKSFNDPTLDALVQEAIHSNLDLKISLSRLREARLETGRASAQFKPAFSANARNLQDISATDTYFHASIDMVWELGLFGAAQSTRQIAEAAAAYADADVQGVRVSVIADVVRNYLDLRSAQRQQAQLEQLVDSAQRLAALTQVRLRTWQGTAEEVVQIQLQVAQLGASQAQVKLAASNAAQALAILLGRATPDPAWLEHPTHTSGLLAPFSLPQFPTDLLRTRPDVKAAEADVMRAAAAAGLARSELYPRITLAGSFLYSYNITRNFRTKTNNAPAVGPIVDIPLFDWGRRLTQVDIKEEALNASLISYQRSVNQGVAETEGALAAMAAQQARAQALDQALSLVRQRTQATQKQRRLGLASEYEVLARQRAEWQAQQELEAAHHAHALAFVALYKALGGAPLPEQDVAAQTSASAHAKVDQ